MLTVEIIREDAEFADARKTFTPNRVSSWLAMEAKHDRVRQIEK